MLPFLDGILTLCALTGEQGGAARATGGGQGTPHQQAGHLRPGEIQNRCNRAQ